MSTRIALLAAVLVWATAPYAQDDSTTGPAEVSRYVDDTLIVREILDAVGWDTIPAAKVTKQADGRVVYLDLSNPSLLQEGIRTLPPKIGELTGLRQLILNKNVLETLPASLANLTDLEVLDLGDNELQAVPEWIGKLRNLRKLDLRNNEFGQLPPGLFALENLWYLHMWGNRLVTISEDLGKLENLKELYVERNRLTMLPKSITTMKSLEYIDYGYNKLCNLDPAVEAWLKKRDKKYRQLQKCW
ncbi:MAG: hypothetical protein GF331_23160 [Chitinivibrionales bacterium]|nr:hypothetical protein [Chitinivibrionales bacterium]